MVKRKYVCRGIRGIITSSHYKKLPRSQQRQCKVVVGGRRRSRGRPRKTRTVRIRID